MEAGLEIWYYNHSNKHSRKAYLKSGYEDIDYEMEKIIK